MITNPTSHRAKITTIIVVALAIMLGMCLASCTSTQSTTIYGNQDNMTRCEAYN